MAQHAEDVRNVREGDTVEITTTEGEHFEAVCTHFDRLQAAEETGEVRETKVWMFDAVEFQPVVSIVDGLLSSEDDPEFPMHNEIWDEQQERKMGYVEDLSIHGPE